MNNHIFASFVSLIHIVTSSQRDASPANASAGERPLHPLRLQRLAREKDATELSTTPNMALRGESTSSSSPAFLTLTCQPPPAHIRTAWGRTARSGRGETTLSFVLPSSKFGKAVGSVQSISYGRGRVGAHHSYTAGPRARVRLFQEAC
jgi:hypothetical protein